MREDFNVVTTSSSRVAYPVTQLHYDPVQWYSWRSLRKGGTHFRAYNAPAFRKAPGVYEVALANTSPAEGDAQNDDILYVGSSKDLSERIGYLVNMSLHVDMLKILPYAEEKLFKRTRTLVTTKPKAKFAVKREEVKDKFNHLPASEKDTLLNSLWIRWSLCPKDYMLLEYILHLYDKPEFWDETLFPDAP